MTLIKTHESGIGGCGSSAATKIDPYPGWVEQFIVMMNQEYTHKCDWIVAQEDTKTIAINFSDAPDLEFTFPRIPPPD
jgi:hypothetical protein